MSVYTSPLPLENAQVQDPLWQREIQLIRHSVIPYQWEALNDRIPGAPPSWWVHNMKAAARAVSAKKAGGVFVPHGKPDSIVTQPADEAHPEADAFYGWVFQDSDGYKWLEAVSYQLIIAPDEKLQALAQQAVDLICAAQEEDGYLDTYYTLTDRKKAFSYLKDHHELYCLGHLAEAAVAWKRATGREDLLNAARGFARCVMNRFGPDKERGCPGHEIAEMALLRMYEETGETQWRDLARFFLDVRGTDPSTFALEENRRRKEAGQAELPVTAERYTYYQANLPVRQMKEAVGHAVRQMYLCSGMADEARLMDDEAMKAACRRLWHSTVREKMYVTGGVGGTHVGEAFSRPFDLPSDTAYSETCAAVGLAFFARRMLQLAPKAEYADEMERALYNTVLAGMALDGQSFFYVNPLEVDPQACETDERLRHVKPTRQKWFGCACCPPNIARLVSSLGQYIATQTENTLYLHLYIGSTLKAVLNGKEIQVKLDADLRKNGDVLLTVLSGEAEGTLALRLPGWAEESDIQGPQGMTVRKENGYVCLTGHWRPGDQIRAAFSMPVRALAASARVKETAGQICFSRGPWVYCAESCDNGNELHLLRVRPQDAACAKTEQADFGDLTLPILRIPAKRVKPEADEPLYAPWRKKETEDTTLTLVPYFAWNNRGEGEMRVWLNRAED